MIGRQVDDLTAAAAILRAGVLVAALREFRGVHDEVVASTGTPVRTCRECWVGFGWDCSPDPDRCLWCAEAHVWREGAAGSTDVTDEALRLSAGRDPEEV